MKRTLSALLAALLVALSPGVEPYRAFAQVVGRSVSASPAALSAAAVGAGAAALRSPALIQSPSLPGRLSPAGALPALVAAPSARAAASPTSVLSSVRAQTLAAPVAASVRSAVPAALAPSLAAQVPAPGPAPAAAASADAAPAAERFVFRGGRLGRVETRFAELRRAFSVRAGVEDAPSAPKTAPLPVVPGSGLGRPVAAAQPSSEAPPAPAPRVEEDLQAHGVSLGRTAARFLQSSASLWIAVTAMEIAAPMLAEKLTGDFSMTGVVFTVGSIVGQLLSPRVISRFGLRSAYQGALVLGGTAGVLLAGAYAAGLLSAPLLMGGLFLYSVANGMWWNANDSVAPHVAGRSRAKLERFWGWDMFVCDVMGTALSMAAGIMIAAHGFVPALVLVPVGFLLATIFSAKGFHRLGRLDDMAPEGPSEGTWAELTRGAKLVFSDAALRASFLAYAGYMLMTPLIYKMLAPGFGLVMMGSANPEGAAGVAGFVSGLYGLGGMLSGLYLMFQGKRLAARRPPMAPEKVVEWERAELKVALLKWMRLAVFGLAAVALMALPLPTLGAAIHASYWLQWLNYLTLPALAMIPFGLIQNVVVLKLRSRLQSIVQDPADQPHVMSFVEISSLALTGAALLAAKFVFGAFPGIAAFGVLAGAMVPLGLLWLKLRAGVAASRTTAGPAQAPK